MSEFRRSNLDPRPVWMVQCAHCKLLLGWAAAEPPALVCIPCFDENHPADFQPEEPTDEAP
jgi:hypothetical protein